MIGLENSLAAIGIEARWVELEEMWDILWSTKSSSQKCDLLSHYLEAVSSPFLKGRLFEVLLALLYWHNGYGVEVTTSSHDGGVDVKVYEKQKTSQLLFLISAKNWNCVLDKPNVRNEICALEAYQKRHSLTGIYLHVFSLQGYTKNAKEFERYGVKLNSKTELLALIKSARLTRPNEPQILELKPHNSRAVDLVWERIKTQQKCCICHATGTGKSYVIMALILRYQQLYPDADVLLCVPSKHIFKQLQESFYYHMNKVRLHTYQTRPDKLPLLAAKSLIILDEFHRCGAAQWGDGIQNLLAAHPDAAVFGTSATPIRHLDEGRDMADELFEGQVMSSIPLAEALQRRLLPQVTLVTALITLDEEIDQRARVISQSHWPEHVKKETFGKLNTLKLNWRKTHDVHHILQKYLPKHITKIVVFFENERHIRDLKGSLYHWFADCQRDLECMTVHSKKGAAANKATLHAFRALKTKDSDRTVHALLCVDMLNEGIHIKDVGAVILLRKTQSPRIYLQQIGRCIQVDSAHCPVIFDLVSNCDQLQAFNFKQDMQRALENENKRRRADGLDALTDNATLRDEVKEIREVLERFDGENQSWGLWFERLCVFKNKEGRWPNKREVVDGVSLGGWCNNQRQSYKKGRLSSDRISQLEGIGFVWDILEQEWVEIFERLCAFKNKEERWPYQKEVVDGVSLGLWCGTQRQSYKKGRLSSDRISQLEGIGFGWDILEQEWVENFERLCAFKNKVGRWPNRKDVVDGFFLGSWCDNQRQSYKKGRLSPEKISQLEGMGFVWDKTEQEWAENFERLCAFKNKEGRWPKSVEVVDGVKLGRWCDTQRQSYKKGRLSSDKISQLEGMGFVWDHLEQAWKENFERLCVFKNKEGRWPNQKEVVDGVPLGSWCDKQRQSYKKGKLSSDRISQLEGMGFVWDQLEQEWAENFERLCAFKNKEGHWPKSVEVVDGVKLGRWCDTQRQSYKKGKLSSDKISQLEGMGFVWDKTEQEWAEKFERLSAFKNKEGRWPNEKEVVDGVSLGLWCGTQRQSYKKGRLSPDKISQLEGMGFVWNLRGG